MKTFKPRTNGKKVKTRNPIAKSVTRIKPKIINSKKIYKRNKKVEIE